MMNDIVVSVGNVQLTLAQALLSLACIVLVPFLVMRSKREETEEGDSEEESEEENKTKKEKV